MGPSDLIDELAALGRDALTPSFLGQLRDVVVRCTRAENFYLMRYPTDGRIEVHEAWMADAAQARHYANFYLSFGSMNDPVTVAAHEAVVPVLYRLHDLPVTPMSLIYFESYFSSTGAQDEIGYIQPAPTGTLCLSIGRNLGQPLFSDPEMSLLRQLCQITMPMCLLSLSDRAHGRGLAPITPDQQIEAASRLAGATLTEREREVAAEILRGRSTIAISLQLSLSVETVKTHRRNLYAKLGISSQAELFSRVLAAQVQR